MSLKSNLLRNAVGVVSLATFLVVAGNATAKEMQIAGVQPDCKASFETIVGPSAATAQAMWVQMVSAKYGTKWAHWVGAKNKTLIPLAGGANPPFQARAKPCFYQPVL